jgi:hypothetical protein
LLSGRAVFVGLISTELVRLIPIFEAIIYHESKFAAENEGLRRWRPSTRAFVESAA